MIVDVKNFHSQYITFRIWDSVNLAFRVRQRLDRHVKSKHQGNCVWR